MFQRHPKTFWLFNTLLIAAFFASVNSTHLKIRKTEKARDSQPGVCFLRIHQGMWHLKGSSTEIYTKHGHCKELSYVGKDFNDDVGSVSFDGDCDTCTVQLFDDVNFGGGSKTVPRKDCTKWKSTCDLDDDDWDDRVSSLKLCCDRIPGNEYLYDKKGDTCRFTVKEDKSFWKLDKAAEMVSSYPPTGGCRPMEFVGADLNDNVASIYTTWSCADCTIQLFDDADLKGDSKTFTIGSDECPLISQGSPSCNLQGWGKRVSSFKTCCPDRLQI